MKTQCTDLFSGTGYVSSNVVMLDERVRYFVMLICYVRGLYYAWYIVVFSLSPTCASKKTKKSQVALCYSVP